MATHKAYLAEQQTLIGEAKIVALIEGERPAVRLDKTYFHPQGGGQKGDRGMIGIADVLDTRHGEEGAVDHFVSALHGLSVGEIYPIAIDAPSRRVNAVSHSAGHLIAALIDAEFPQIRAVQGHHWPGEARVEFEGAIGDDLAPRIEAFLPAALEKALAENWPVTLTGDPFVNRSIQIAASNVPCGGTHVASLGQIKSVTLRGVKEKGDRLRVNYECVANDTVLQYN